MVQLIPANGKAATTRATKHKSVRPQEFEEKQGRGFGQSPRRYVF
jgi:hypothetical protein